MELKKGAPRNLAGFDAGQSLDELGNIAAGVDQGLEGIDYLAALELDCAHFNDGVPVLVQPRGLQVDGHVG